MKALRILSVLFVWISSVAIAVGPESDIQVAHIKRPKTDIEVRIETVLNAKESVDVITYHHDATTSSMLFMEALRMAALKGVKVRYFYDHVASTVGGTPISDSYWAVLRQAGVEVYAVNVASRLKKWGPFDMIHSKWLFADAGDREHSIAVLTGRNFGDRYVKWIDNSFAFRIENTSDFHNELRDYMDIVQTQVDKVETRYKQKPIEPLYANEAELRAEIKAYFGTDTTYKEALDFRNFLNTGKASILPVIEMKSSEVKFISSGIIEKKAGRPQVDEIQKSLADILENSKSVDVSTILAALTKEKREIFHAFLQRGGNLNFMTNDFRTLSSAMVGASDLPARSLAKLQEKEFMDLSKSGFVAVHTLNPGQFVYHHSKFAVGETGVLLSSSNMNYSSDVHAEESGLYIKSKRFASYIRGYSRELKQEFFSEYDYENGQRLNMVERSCSMLLRHLF